MTIHLIYYHSTGLEYVIGSDMTCADTPTHEKDHPYPDREVFGPPGRWKCKQKKTGNCPQEHKLGKLACPGRDEMTIWEHAHQKDRESTTRLSRE